ncbi:OBAP family protein [Larkinella ripae]
MIRFGFYILLAASILACGGDFSSSQKQAADPAKTGSSDDESKTAVPNFDQHFSGFHFYNGHRAGQLETHHFCQKFSAHLTQCVILDGSGPNARLMGVEYIISDSLFRTLPDDEKKLWHSYRYAVKSGLLMAPDLAPEAEHKLMTTLVSAYGKTWQTWHTGQDFPLPYGGPALMMSFTRDGQLDPALLQNRDRRLKESTAEKQKQRSDILGRPALSGADSWQNGAPVQLPALTSRNYRYLQKDSLR